MNTPAIPIPVHLSRSKLLLHRSGPIWLAAAFVALNLVAQDADSARAASLRMAADIVQQWRPHQRLYVKGNVGVAQDQLDALERWLDAQAPSWVVLLGEHAQGEQYTDSMRQQYSGLDAVEHALGKGLLGASAFGQQVDPRTQERNAAVLAIVLQERGLLYFASDAYDRRGLGEANWLNQLDGPAKAAMRGGGRIVDAVKDTVTFINGELAKRVNAEFEARNRQAAEEEVARQQAQTQAKAHLTNAFAAIALLDSQATRFRQSRPDLTGNLARPDLAGLRAELQTAQAAFQRGSPQQAVQAAIAIQRKVESSLRALDQYVADRQRLSLLGQRISSQRARDKAAVARRSLGSAEAALANAQAEYQRGDAAYLAQLEAGSHALASAETAINAHERLTAQVRLLWGVSAGLWLAGLGVVGLLLNRRRLPTKVESEGLLRAWENALGEKNVALFELLDRRAGLVGASADEAAQRYSGETLRLSQQTIQDVDELFIMSSCAGRVLQRAKGLVQPEVVWPRLVNLFFRRRYLQASRMLRDQPVAFRPEEGLELVVRGPRTERDRLLGSLASYQPFTMTFTHLIEEFNMRAGRALSALDLVESALINIGRTLEDVQKTIDAARSLEPEVARGAAEDGLFGVPKVFDGLLPAAADELSEAVKIALTDPVGSLQTHGATAKQRAEDALALVTVLLQEGRGKCLLRVRQAEGLLAAQKLSTGWTATELTRLSQAADDIVLHASQAPTGEEIGALRADFDALAARAEQAVLLDNQRRETSQVRILDATAAIEAARREIGGALGRDATTILRETGADPSDRVSQAEAQYAATQAALERGDVVAAQSAIQSVAQLTTEAMAIVDDSRQAFQEHDGRLAALRSETREVADLIPDHAESLLEIKKRYAASVVLLGAGDPTHPNANGTIEDNVTEAEDHVAAARQFLSQSVVSFQVGRVLESADIHRQAKGNLESALHRLREIKEKEDRLTQTDATNAGLLSSLEVRRGALARLADEPATMTATLDLLAEACSSLDTGRGMVEATVRDPFAAAAKLTEVGQAFDVVSDKARCDRDIFEEAARSVTAAGNQFADADRLERQAAADGVQDSTEIREARAELQALGAALDRARRQSQAAHGDWPALDAEADRITNRAAACAATLRGELRKADQATAALSASAAAVRVASAWTGGCGVVILGSPGGDSLSEARHLLQQGRYGEAQQVAERARQMAELAVTQAEAEVRRRRRAEQEERERQRRRREAEEEARRQSRSSSFGSGGGISSWGGSSSGGSRSSFSTGSGGSRSSW